MSDWRDQEAANQTIFRENSWTDEAFGRSRTEGDLDANRFGPNRSYSGRLRLIGSVQRHPNTRTGKFAIARNHENPELDSVVAENDRFPTVDKVEGSAARIARASDPRRSVD